MAELHKLAPRRRNFAAISELALFLAVLAAAFSMRDTGPLHFAAGLGVPTVSLFGPTSPARWAPVGARHQVLTGAICGCDGNAAHCTAARHCLEEISPADVLAALSKASIENLHEGG